MKNNNQDLGIFLIRLAIGLVFVIHGWDKWQDMASTIKFFASLDLSANWAYLVASVELLGGLSLILGIYHKWAGLLLAAVMAGAVYLTQGSHEYELVLLACALALAVIPPGRYVAIKQRH